MHRFIVIALIAVAACLGFAASAQAGDPDPVVPPAFAPPGPAPVVDNDSAANFAKAFAARNASRFLRQDRRRVRVIDVNAACLQSPVVATRFGCVFTLRALVILRRSHGWDHWGDHKPVATPTSRRGGDHGRRHFRVRSYGCLGFLRINGGPTATPSAQLINVECGRVPRDDLEAPEPVQ